MLRPTRRPHCANLSVLTVPVAAEQLMPRRTPLSHRRLREQKQP